MRYPSSQDFADALTLSLGRGVGGRAGNLFWANGILFRHFTFNPSGSVLNEYLNGHLPIDHVEYAPMPAYANEIRSGEIIVTVLDVSDHTILSVIGKWLADSEVKKRSSSSRRRKEH